MKFSDIIKVCRSNHCFYCKKCVKKFQLHSDWFNICVGGSNEIIYSIALFSANWYIFSSNCIIWYYILLRPDLLTYFILIFSLFGFIGLYIIFNSIKFLYSFIFEHLIKNLTIYENQNIRRLTYLWSEERRGSFFNPFDKGIQRNIEEMMVNAFDVDIYSEYKNFTSQNLAEIIDDDSLNEKDEDYFYYNEMDAFKIMIKLVEHFDPFITSKGNIYKFIDGKEIINWNRLMIFTVFDIINSPFKENMLNKAKMMLNRQNYMQNMRINYQMQNYQNMKNFNNIEVNKNKEVIDNNENKDNNQTEDNEKKSNKENKDNNENKENKDGNENKESNVNDDKNEKDSDEKIDENNDMDENRE